MGNMVASELLCAVQDLSLAVQQFQEERCEFCTVTNFSDTLCDVAQLEIQFNTRVDEASASVREHQKLFESLSSLPDDLRGVVDREELKQIQSDLSRETALIESSNQKTDQLQQQLERVWNARGASLLILIAGST